MKMSTYTTLIIEPDEGNWLTQASDVEIMERMFFKKIYLAINDDEGNWLEITDEEYQEYIYQQQQYLAEHPPIMYAKLNDGDNSDSSDFEELLPIPKAPMEENDNTDSSEFEE